MREFIDLEGASGSQYRFRLWPAGSAHLPVAGNYVLMRRAGEGVTVQIVGATNDLSQARRQCGKGAGGEALVYTRLNVVRAVRTAEHQDLAARYTKARVTEEVG
jgi:hypothetical protein